ncbi:MAG: DUF547 domain-containing protein [Pseudomonadales bacterium]
MDLSALEDASFGVNRSWVMQGCRLLCMCCLVFVFIAPNKANDASRPERTSFDHTHAQWADLLERAVYKDRDGSASKLDYQIFADDSGTFADYLKGLSDVSAAQFRGFSSAEQLAFLLNAYNAFMVAKVMMRYPKITSVWDFGRVFNSPFKHRFFELLGDRRSLDDIEHGLIRGDSLLMDPRIHFAVNCASVGCPALRDEPFLSSQIDAQLEDQTIRFLKDRTRNYFDRGSRRLVVSPLFDWYSGDFEPPDKQSRDGVVGFLHHYRAALGLTFEEQKRLLEGRVKIGYSNYDWRLNDFGGGGH